MRETTIPLAIERPDLLRISDILEYRVRADPEHVAFARRVNGELTDVTTAQFFQEVRALAKGLVAAGVQHGEPVAIMSPTRYEWAVADFAIWTIGAVVVPIYDTASPTQIAPILRDCGFPIALVGGRAHREIIESAVPGTRVWTFDPDTGRDLTALIDLGSHKRIEDREIDRRRTLSGPDDLASIVFTSGTTGAQKGVRITHSNFVQLVVQIAAAYQEVVNDRASTVILLPLAHVLSQGLQLVSVYAGMKVVHEDDPRAAVAVMAEVRPTFLVVVPRILEKIRSAAKKKAQDSRLERMFAAAESTAIAWGEHLERCQDNPASRPPYRLAIKHAIFDRLFYRRLRALMGGRIDYLLSGASPLDRDLCNFYRGIGVPVLEGYGLTETTAPVTGNRPGQIRAGSVGIPIPGSSVRISDDGEVLVRGVGVSPGYLQPQQGQEAYVDGFYRTGDIGRLDEQGFLYLEGRLKNILVTANGKNVAPEPWEQAVSEDPLVEQAVMVGEGRPFISALIVLDTDEALAWAKSRGAATLVEYLVDAATSSGPSGFRVVNEAIVAHIQSVIDRANAAVSRAEQVRRFIVLISDLNQKDETLTPTLKLRRATFLNAVAHHVDDLYQEKD